MFSSSRAKFHLDQLIVSPIGSNTPDFIAFFDTDML